MTRRRCPYCYCTNTKRNGTTTHGKTQKQRYLCRDCSTTWSNMSRPERFIRKLWREYAWEGASVAALAERHHKSRSTIRRLLDNYIPENDIVRPRPVVTVMDVTYFGSWGILVVIDPNAKAHGFDDEILYWAEITGTERTADYEVATDTLEAMGYHIQAVVIDGRRGVRDMLERKGIPVQHCQFHQLQTVTQCLTKRPKLPQNQQLRAIALTLTRTSKQRLEQQLDAWYEQHGEWLKERSAETQGAARNTQNTHSDRVSSGSRYAHARTRRAYFSLRRNLEYLFTYQDLAFIAQDICIPNTTNALDGRFGVWKTKLRAHRGCSKQRKFTILRSFFSGGTDEGGNTI